MAGLRRRRALCGNHTPAKSDFKPELIWRREPGRYRHSAKKKRIGAGRIRPTKTGTATAVARAPHHLPVRVGHVVPPAIGISERLDARADLPLQLHPRHRHFRLRHRRGYAAQIDVRVRMSANLEAVTMQRANLVPSHPWI